MSEDKKSSIKCQAIEHIRGYGSPSRWNVRFSIYHGIAVINCGSDCLFIYDKDSKKLGSLKFPGLCHCHDLISHKGLLSLVCGLKDGRIFSCSLQQWCHQKKKKKNKSKSKKKTECSHTESEKGDEHQGLKEQRKEKERLDGEEDIFRDLLEGGDGSSSATKAESHDAADIQFQEFLQTVGAVTMVDEQKVILDTNNLEGFVIVNDSLVTCCHEGVGWRISVHSCQTNNADVDSVICDKNPLYSTLIFGADVDSSHHTFNGPSKHTLSSSSNQGATYSSEWMDAMIFVGVYGLVSSSSHGNSSTVMQSCSILVTSDALFDAMWGSEANLVDSPVILITLPDGCVYSILLKSFHPTSFSSSSAKAIKLLCRSQEQVSQVGTVSYSNQSNPAGSGLDCLVLVGAGGQLMIFYVDPMDNNCTEIARLHTSAPISVAVAMKDTLICASNFDLHFVTFHLKDAVLQMTVKSWSMPGVATMAVLKGTSSSYKLLAIKKNGTVLQLILPSEHTTDMDQSGIGSTAARQRVHEALRNMREVSSKMAALTRLGSRQRAILEELSSAHHIVCQTWETSDAFELESRVECILENGQKRTKVSCKVTNCTSWTMSHGWTLIGTVSSCCDERWKDGGSKYHRTKSIPLVGFAPKTSVIFSFVLDESGTAMSWPLTVHCSLCFDLSALMEDTLPKEDLSNVAESSVTLDGEVKGAVFLIGSSVVDTLDSLQQRSHGGAGMERSHQECDRTKTAFRGLPGGPQPNQQVSPATRDQVASITLQLDRTLLYSLSDDGSRSPSEQVLHQLLPSNQSAEVKDLCIEAMTPCGCLVSIQALECDADRISLQVTSSDEKIMRGLVEAIHRRIKNSKLMATEFRVDREGMKKEASIVKSLLGKLLSISDQLNAEKSRKHLTILVKEVMDLHANMRNQMILH